MLRRRFSGDQGATPFAVKGCAFRCNFKEGGVGKSQISSSSTSAAERILVQAQLRRHPSPIVDGQHIEAARAIAHMALAQESPRRPYHDALLVGGHAQFRQSRQRTVAHGARSYFHECQRAAVVPDQIDLTLGTARHVIARDEHVPPDAANTSSRRFRRGYRCGAPAGLTPPVFPRRGFLAPRLRTRPGSRRNRRASRCEQPNERPGKLIEEKSHGAIFHNAELTITE
jgi:hypothetical protein